jgi:hypothetical protein
MMSEFADQTKRICRVIARAVRRLALNPAEALLITRMAAWVIVLSAVVRMFSLPRALKLIAAKQRSGRKRVSTAQEQRLARAIDLLLATNVFVFKPVCWKRAAILHRYLALLGIPTQIVFGVREGGGDVDGHAWLEADGNPILETKPLNYRVTYTFPSSGRADVQAFQSTSFSLPS